ncbi:hypothetical protein Btru_063565 [Bulinus truncatus]|nr:hypothetical protein Btru_063565 [Bulinus truncatus]
MPTLSHKSDPVAVVDMNEVQVTSFGKLRQTESHLNSLFQTNELSYIKRLDGSNFVSHQPILLRGFNNTASQDTGYYTDKAVLNTQVKNLRSTDSSGFMQHQGSNVKTATAQKREIERKSSSSKKTLRTKKLNSMDSSPYYADKIHTIKSLETNKLNKRNFEMSNKEKLDAFSALCKGINLKEKSMNKIYTEYGKSFPIRHPSKTSLSKQSQVNSNNMVDVENYNSLEMINYTQRRKFGLKEEGVKTTKIFLSEKQSGLISDCGMKVPCAPPTTPTPDQLKKTEYVPSLQDIKAQRLVRQRLQVIEEKEIQKEKKKKETQDIGCQKSLKEIRQDLKKMQRREIYALNKVMTDLEYQNFCQYMESMNADDYY